MNAFWIAGLVLGACVVLHEFGHWILLSLMNKRVVRIGFTLSWSRVALLCGRPEDYKDLTALQHLIVLGTGVLAGFVPLFLIAGRGMVGVALVCLMVYMWGCTTDLRIFMRVFRETDWSVEFSEDQSAENVEGVEGARVPKSFWFRAFIGILIILLVWHVVDLAMHWDTVKVDVAQWINPIESVNESSTSVNYAPLNISGRTTIIT